VTLGSLAGARVTSGDGSRLQTNTSLASSRSAGDSSGSGLFRDATPGRRDTVTVSASVESTVVVTEGEQEA
jgi:hypothetical protein